MFHCWPIVQLTCGKVIMSLYCSRMEAHCHLYFPPNWNNELSELCCNSFLWNPLCITSAKYLLEALNTLDIIIVQYKYQLESRRQYLLRICFCWKRTTPKWRKSCQVLCLFFFTRRRHLAFETNKSLFPKGSFVLVATTKTHVVEQNLRWEWNSMSCCRCSRMCTNPAYENRLGMTDLWNKTFVQENWAIYATISTHLQPNSSMPFWCENIAILS